MKSGCRGALVDGLGTPDDPSAQPPGTLRNHVYEEVFCVTGLRLSPDGPFEKPFPVRQQMPVTVAVQGFNEFLVLLLLHVPQKDHQRFHVGRREFFSMLSESED